MKIFLGYASENLEVAWSVYEELAATNHDIWFDKISLTGADNWDREREAAQQNADYVVHLISEVVMQRAGVVNREINKTLRLYEDQPIGTNYVLFVRLDGLLMPPELMRFQYVDQFVAGWKTKLLQAIQKRAEQLASRPTSLPKQKPDTSDERQTPICDPAAKEISKQTAHSTAIAKYLKYPGEGLYARLVNSRIEADILGEFTRYVGIFSNLSAEEQARTSEYGHRFEWNSSMQEFFRRDEMISIRSMTYVDQLGAHPNYLITTHNFLGPIFGAVEIRQLLGANEDAARRLLGYCKKVIAANFEDPSLEQSIEMYVGDGTGIWDVLSNYNFDASGLTLNFSPYDVLAYAYGSHEVFVPWSFAEGLLDEDMRCIANLDSGH